MQQTVLVFNGVSSVYPRAQYIFQMCKWTDRIDITIQERFQYNMISDCEKRGSLQSKLSGIQLTPTHTEQINKALLIFEYVTVSVWLSSPRCVIQLNSAKITGATSQAFSAIIVISVGISNSQHFRAKIGPRGQTNSVVHISLSRKQKREMS